MKVSLVAAITVDGFIGRHDSDLSIRWTSREDTKFFVKKSKEIVNLVVGSTTFAAFDRKLEGRKFYVYSRNETVENPYDNDIVVVNESPEQLVTRLESEGIENLMIAGGGEIYNLFMRAGVVDELFLTLEPVVFGEGIKLFSGRVDSTIKLHEIIDLSEQTKVLHYIVEKP